MEKKKKKKKKKKKRLGQAQELLTLQDLTKTLSPHRKKEESHSHHIATNWSKQTTAR